MSIKLIAKKKIGFRNPDDGTVLTAEPLVFSTMPDWIAKDPIYGWAKSDGTIEVSEEVAVATSGADTGKDNTSSGDSGKKK